MAWWRKASRRSRALTRPEGVPIMGDDLLNTLPETPSAKVAAAKPDVQKSEFWMALVTIVGTLGASFATTGMVGKIFALAGLVLTAGVYAYFRTPLPSEKPGWKTTAFLGAVLSIIASVAVAISEADLPFLPPGVTKVAAVVSAAIVSAGYSVYRFRVKRAVITK